MANHTLEDKNMDKGKHPAGMNIADCLRPGQENAQPMRHLMAVTGMDSRSIRRMVLRERRAGAAICCAGSGYFLARTEEEKKACARSLRHRAAEIFSTARALEKAEITSEEEES